MSHDTGIQVSPGRSDALIQAAVFGGEAPSLHNTQPWRWRVGGDLLELRLDQTRLLLATDPECRLAVLSCGAALHHARLQLAALGWRITVRRMPDEVADPDCLAQIRVGGRTVTDTQAMRLIRAAAHRHTDRRSDPGVPLDFDKLRTIGAAVSAEGAALPLLRPRQVFDLAEAVDRANRIASGDAGRQSELADWVGGRRPSGTGIPSAALPADPLMVTAPGQALRRAGAALVAESRQHASVFGVLCHGDDERPAWLQTGEALSAGWLTATDLGVSVLPLSVVTEVGSSREMMHRLVGRAGYPYLVLRFAVANPAGAGPRTPRLPAAATIEMARRVD